MGRVTDTRRGPNSDALSGAPLFQPMATPWDHRSQKESALQGHPQFPGFTLKWGVQG
jgi:hypothetical protein